MKILIPVLAFLFFVAPSAAHACSCAFSDPPSAFNRAEAVFIGRMLGGTEQFTVKGQKGETAQLEAGQVRFAVDELFKGKAPASNELVVTIASMRGTSCGDYGLKRGETYLVYAYRDDRNKTLLYTGVCTRTSSVDYEDAKKEDLVFLRNLPPEGTGGNIRGRLWADERKVRGGGAEPLAGVRISVTSSHGVNKVVTTDASGDFELKSIKAGKYKVEPHLPPSYFIEEPFELVEVADRGTAGVSFEAYFKGFASGRLIDVNGVGFNSGMLQLLSANEDRHVYGHSDGANGVFSFEGVPPGEYIMFLDLQHKDYDKNKKFYYPGTFNRMEAKSVRVDLGKKVDGLVFTLPKEFQVRTIEGQAVWQNGRPAKGVQILLLCPSSSNQNGFRVESGPTSVETDANGRFRIEGFTGETYWLKGRGSTGNLYFESATRRIELRENLKNIKVVLSERPPFSSCGN